MSYKFGLTGMAAGALGVPAGAALAQRLRRRAPDCDPLICGAALLASAPLVFLALVALQCSGAAALAYLLVFLGMLALNLTWSIVADVVLVSAARRGIPTRLADWRHRAPSTACSLHSCTRTYAASPFCLTFAYNLLYYLIVGFTLNV